MNNWKLFLDDIRQPDQVSDEYKDLVVARSYDEAVDLIKKNGCPSFISFDHDLALDHYAPTNSLYKVASKSRTGYDLAQWLVYKDLDARGKFIPDNFSFYVHSMNPVGKNNIQKFLDSYFVFKQEDKCRKDCSRYD